VKKAAYVIFLDAVADTTTTSLPAASRSKTGRGASAKESHSSARVLDTPAGPPVATTRERRASSAASASSPPPAAAIALVASGRRAAAERCNRRGRR